MSMYGQPDKTEEKSFYRTNYVSPVGTLLLEADGEALLRVVPGCGPTNDDFPVLRKAIRWLDAYFQGGLLSELPPLHPQGTPFQHRVWKQLLQIPYGTTRTYGQLAGSLCPVTSPRAVGQALSLNPIAIIIPCHRIVGAHGPGGYAYGPDMKRYLLEHEAMNTPMRLFREYTQ